MLIEFYCVRFGERYDLATGRHGSGASRKTRDLPRYITAHFVGVCLRALYPKALGTHFGPDMNAGPLIGN